MEHPVGMNVSAHYRSANFKPSVNKCTDSHGATYYRVKLDCDVIGSPVVDLYMTPAQVQQLAVTLNAVLSNANIVEYAS